MADVRVNKRESTSPTKVSEVNIATLATESTSKSIKKDTVIIADSISNLNDTAGSLASEETLSSIEETLLKASTSLNQYNQIDLLTLIYEELQTQTKLLKKIYQ